MPPPHDQFLPQKKAAAAAATAADSDSGGSGAKEVPPNAGAQEAGGEEEAEEEVMGPAGQLMELVRRAVKRRYTLLPYIYTQFALGAGVTTTATTGGGPVLRPFWWEFTGSSFSSSSSSSSSSAALHGEEGGFMLGDALAVVPVTQPGVREVAIKLPRGSHWYDVSALWGQGGPYPSPATAITAWT
eukprot:COSAG05_NODE_6758_length_907_cov_0.832921_2_plen_185_part_01